MSLKPVWQAGLEFSLAMLAFPARVASLTSMLLYSVCK